MADIFLSYARKDEERIRDLVHALEEHGWSIFWDRRIPSGKPWQSYISQALSDAKLVVIAWSKHSITSEYVLEEANAAKKRGVIVPVRLDAVDPPFGFTSIQAADLTEWKMGQSSPSFDQLIQDIAGVVGDKPRRAAPEGGLTSRAQPVTTPGAGPTERAPQELTSPTPGPPPWWKKRRIFLTGGVTALAIAIVAGSALWFFQRSQPLQTGMIEPQVTEILGDLPKAQAVPTPEIKPAKPKAVPAKPVSEPLTKPLGLQYEKEFDKMGNKGKYIFLSYAREDEAYAIRVFQDLKNYGLHVWFDKESLLPGQNYKLVIRNAIKESTLVIVLLSSKSIAKQGYVQKELREVIDVLDEIPESEIFLIPVRLDECKPSHPRLEDIHGVDLFPSYEYGFERILRAISQRIEMPEIVELIYFSAGEKKKFDMIDKLKEALDLAGIKRIDNTSGPFNPAVGYHIRYTPPAIKTAEKIKALLIDVIQKEEYRKYDQKISLSMQPSAINKLSRVWVDLG